MKIGGGGVLRRGCEIEGIVQRKIGVGVTEILREGKQKERAILFVIGCVGKEK